MSILLKCISSFSIYCLHSPTPTGIPLATASPPLPPHVYMCVVPSTKYWWLHLHLTLRKHGPTFILSSKLSLPHMWWLQLSSCQFAGCGYLSHLPWDLSKRLLWLIGTDTICQLPDPDLNQRYSISSGSDFDKFPQKYLLFFLLFNRIFWPRPCQSGHLSGCC